MADRKSVKGLPDVLNAAEFAVCKMRAARRGSAPTMVTTRSAVVFGSANAVVMGMTTSGKHGRSIDPSETSDANFCRNSKAAARSCGVDAAPLAGTDCVPDRYVGGAPGSDIRVHAMLEGITDGDDQRLRPETDAGGADDPRGIGTEFAFHLRGRIGRVQMPIVRDVIVQPYRAHRPHRRRQRELGGTAAGGVALRGRIPIIETGVIDAGADVRTPLRVFIEEHVFDQHGGRQ